MENQIKTAQIENIIIERSKSFDQNSVLDSNAKTQMLVERGVIREMLLEGNFKNCEAFIKENFSKLWNENPHIRFSIWALQFIEYLKDNKSLDAVKFARDTLGSEDTKYAFFVSRDKDGYEKLLGIEDLFSLLCYENIQNSPVRHLLLPIQRESVGDYINKQILTLKGKNEITALEKSLKQLVVSQNYMLEKSHLKDTFKLKI